jgi:DnaJ family protein A protein 2
MDDLFAQMFGGGGFSFNGGAGASFDTRGESSRGPRRGRDFDIRKDITLEDAYTGKTIHVKLERNKLCGRCEGTGGKKGGVKVQCGRCAGKGSVFEDRQVRACLDLWLVCARGQSGADNVACARNDWEGKGDLSCLPWCARKVYRITSVCTSLLLCFLADPYSESEELTDRCSKCKGTCVTKSSKTVEVVIEPGTSHGERICLQGQADEAVGIAFLFISPKKSCSMVSSHREAER